MSAKPIAYDRPSVPFAARSLFGILERLQCGRLSLELPDGSMRVFTGREAGPEARFAIRDWSAIAIMLRKSEIGVAECWRDGLVDTPDMTAVLVLCARNQAALSKVFYGNPLVALLLRIAHVLRPNTRAGSRKNIHAHYDLGNAFYRLWLDETMTYSSGIFGHPGERLEEAQDKKYERILGKLGIDSSHHVLEIGCGWGGFAEYAARTRGCHVTGVTISKAQLAFAQERIRRAGPGGLRRAQVLRLSRPRGRVRPHRLHRDGGGGGRALLARVLRHGAQVPPGWAGARRSSPS